MRSEAARYFHAAIYEIVQGQFIFSGQVDTNAACPWLGPVRRDRNSGQAEQAADGCAIAIRIPPRGDRIADRRTEILMR